MTTAISEDLRARRSEIVTQHIDAENRHDPDGVVATFDQPNYDIPSFGDAGQVNGPQAVRELWQETDRAWRRRAGPSSARPAPWRSRPSPSPSWAERPDPDASVR